jgi:hypothetical protein
MYRKWVLEKVANFKALLALQDKRILKRKKDHSRVEGLIRAFCGQKMFPRGHGIKVNLSGPVIATIQMRLRNMILESASTLKHEV